MANNLSITPGTGATAAAESIAAVLYPQAKLIDATAGSTNPTGVAANPLQVSLANNATNSVPVKIDGSGVTQPVSIASMPTTPVTGTFFQATQPVSLATAPTTPVTGTFWQTTQPISQVPTTSGGLTQTKIIAAASTNATSIKGSAGQVYGYYMYNTASYAIFVKLYNKATAPTVGTDTPLRTIGLPAGGAANLSYAAGLSGFTNGIGLAITKLAADADTTALVAGDAIINIDTF